MQPSPRLSACFHLKQPSLCSRSVSLSILTSPSPRPLSGLAFLSVNQTCPQQPLPFHLLTRPFISWHVGAESKGTVSLQLHHLMTPLSLFLLYTTITTYKQQCSDVPRVAPLVNWLQLLQVWAALLPAARQKEAEWMPDFYGMCGNSSTQHGSLSISTHRVSFLIE